MPRTKKNKFAPGRFSHLPKSERPKMRDSKEVKEAKMRKPGEGGDGSGAVGKKGGKGKGRKRVKTGDGKTGGKEEGGKVKRVQASQQNVVPFDVFDRVLCVGEGDLSFTTSLLLDHGCASITSTTFDSESELLQKYPHVTSAIETIKETEQTLFHNIDATKLSSYKILRSNGPYDRIFFMFPHVGGKSTSVNKQVRANQALLAGFFSSAKDLLRKEADERERVNGDPGASILVTVFEGEPEARTYEFGIKPEEVEKQDLSSATGGNDVPLAIRGGKKIDYLKRKWNEDSSTDED
ncbi:hypothetical protein EG328_008005 [Venturia inaequalis]|uniref:25S rRNA (uridine-N(3))-methyltransferase BMT5-like domain-containing protein n=1 Tax=Venturia inaequalis TaxID=5025 RepID=A0A8H3Z3Z5_VENIN|nr:hypothetical protein EG328_008005 [Venturia inaequalis]